jgi:hypothetical protein
MMRTEKRAHEVVGGRDGGHFDVLIGDSVYTASMAMFLPELLSFCGHVDLGRGIFVAVPYRHQVAFRVIDGPDAARGLQNLFGFALAGYDDGAGPLSPHVFWVKDGHWEQVTSHDEDGPQIVVGDHLAEALGLTGE